MRGERDNESERKMFKKLSIQPCLCDASEEIACTSHESASQHNVWGFSTPPSDTLITVIMSVVDFISGLSTKLQGCNRSVRVHCNINTICSCNMWSGTWKKTRKREYIFPPKIAFFATQNTRNSCNNQFYFHLLNNQMRWANHGKSMSHRSHSGVLSSVPVHWPHCAIPFRTRVLKIII